MSEKGSGHRLRADLLAAALIVAAAVVLGLLQNSLLASPLSLTHGTQPGAVASVASPGQGQGGTGGQEGALFIDTRSPEQYAAGHIKGALNLPYADREKLADGLLAGIPHSRRLIAYCDFGCDTAPRLAVWLQSKGWTDVAVLSGGYSAWRGAGQPVTTGVEP